MAATAAIDHEGLVAATEQVAQFLLSVIEAIGVNAKKPLHSIDQVSARRFSDQVKVVVHQAERVDLPIGLLAGLPERLQKQEPVLVVVKNWLAPVATVHDVVDRPGVLHSEFASH